MISWRGLQKHWASIHRISQFVCEKLWYSFAIRFWQTLGREFLYKKAQRSSFGRALQSVGLYFLSASFLKKNNVVETHTYPFIKYFEAAECDISKQNIALPTWLIVSNTVSILWNSTNWHLRLRSQKSRFWPAILFFSCGRERCEPILIQEKYHESSFYIRVSIHCMKRFSQGLNILELIFFLRLVPSLQKFPLNPLGNGKFGCNVQAIKLWYIKLVYYLQQWLESLWSSSLSLLIIQTQLILSLHAPAQKTT